MNIQNFPVPISSSLPPRDVPPGSTKITIGLVSRAGTPGGQPTFTFQTINFAATVTEIDAQSNGSGGNLDSQPLSDLQFAPGIEAGGEDTATITGDITSLSDNAQLIVSVVKNDNDGPIAADITVNFS